MALFDWSREERKAAIRNLTNGRMKLLSVDWFVMSVPVETAPIIENESGGVYRFPTTTAKLCPLEMETMAIQRTSVGVFRMQCQNRIPATLDSFLKVTRGDITKGMLSPEVSSINEFQIFGCSAKREIIRSVEVTSTHIVIDFNDGCFTCIAFMYEKCKEQEYNIFINKVLDSITINPDI